MVNIIKNGKYQLLKMAIYFHFNKITKEPETSFQSPTLSQKHARNAFRTAQLHLTKFHFNNT